MCIKESFPLQALEILSNQTTACKSFLNACLYLLVMDLDEIPADWCKSFYVK